MNPARILNFQRFLTFTQFNLEESEFCMEYVHVQVFSETRTNSMQENRNSFEDEECRCFVLSNRWGEGSVFHSIHNC